MNHDVPPFVLLLLLVPVSFGVLWLLQIWFLAEMRRLEPRAWRLIASPRWVKTLSGPPVSFIQSGSYRKLRSRKLRRLGRVIHVVQVIAILFFVVIFTFALLAGRP